YHSSSASKMDDPSALRIRPRWCESCITRGLMQSNSARAGRGWYLLLLLPFVAMLWVPFYNSIEPKLAGVPYFYWYQFLWVLISAAITTVVYFATREPDLELPSEPLNEDFD